MRCEAIAEIAIDAEGRLCIRPESLEFPFIHRAAMQVGWNAAERQLFSPTPKDRSLADWFEQMLAAVREEYGVTLALAANTTWRDVARADRDAIRRVCAGGEP